jgi:hypothetical protein
VPSATPLEHPGAVVRSPAWHGVCAGEAVTIYGVKERRQHWTFVAHARNEATGDEWIEVRGGRVGESKGRSFRPELIYPAGALRGGRVLAPSLADAPRLALG